MAFILFMLGITGVFLCGYEIAVGTDRFLRQNLRNLKKINDKRESYGMLIAKKRLKEQKKKESGK